MAPNIEFNTNTLTTNGGTPVANNRFTLRAGPRGTLPCGDLAVLVLQAVPCLPSCSAAARYH
jgi:catalase